MTNKYHLNILCVLLATTFFFMLNEVQKWIQKERERVEPKGFYSIHVDKTVIFYKLVGVNMADLWKPSITISAQWLLTMANNFRQWRSYIKTMCTLRLRPRTRH